MWPWIKRWRDWLMNDLLPLYRLGAGWEVAVAATLASALGGFLFVRPSRERLNPGAAGLAAPPRGSSRPCRGPP